MKRWMACFVAAVLLCASAALGEAGLAGGWTVADSAEVTEDMQLLFEKAMAEMVGVDYMPVAVLGSQLVAGTNYCFLCRATVVYPNAQPYYALVYLYQDLNGNASVLQIDQLEIGLHP